MYLKATFQALVEAIIPLIYSPSGCGFHPIVGATQLCVDEFVIKQIDHSQFVPIDAPEGAIVPLSLSTAGLLDIGADALVRNALRIAPFNAWLHPEGGTFSALSCIDRLRSIALLNQQMIPLQDLPFPYQNNPGLIQTMMDSLHQLTMFGYYSEWFGYGSTRLYPPVDQRVQFYPPGWRLSGYPGPAFGYRALRETGPSGRFP